MYACTNHKYRNEITSQKWGKLTVISFAGYTPKHRRTVWNCQCDCGNIVQVRSDCLRSKTATGGTKSCGRCVRSKTGSESAAWKGCGQLSATRWERILADAKSRKLNVSITIKDAWDLLTKQDWKCAITGKAIMLPSRTKGEETTASLDRIDSTKGYTLDNIQWVHKRINWMKSNMSMNEFVDFCKAVVNHQTAK